MAGYSKSRGNKAEDFVVKRALEFGLEAERFWGSDGRSAGMEYADDGWLSWWRWQSKRFKFKNVVRWFITNVIDYLQGEQDVVTIYVDKAPGHPRTVYVVQKLDDWLRIQQMAVLYGKHTGQLPGRPAPGQASQGGSKK